MSEDTLEAITGAIEMGRDGNPAAARDELIRIWETLGPLGDPLARCTLAHFLADLYDDAALALTWDIRAIDAADALTDQRLAEYHPGLHVRGFYPSLHLNLADNYRRLGSFDTATRHLTAVRASLHTLEPGEYDTVIRTALDEIEAAIRTGDTAPRPSAPTGRPQ